MKKLFYRYKTEDLFTGSSLGNSYAFMQLDARTRLKGLWSSIDNQFYLGEWSIEINAGGEQLKPRETLFTPHSQTTMLHGTGVAAEIECFVPFSLENRSTQSPSDLQMVVYLVRLNNLNSLLAEISIHHLLTFPAVPSDLFMKKPPEEQTQKRVKITRRPTHCEIHTLSSPLETRVFGSDQSWTSLSSDSRSLKVEFRNIVPPGATVEIPFILTFSPNGVGAALEAFTRHRDVRKVLDHAITEYEKLLARTFLFTPDPLINRGLQWSKVNTVRVQHRYRIGEGFTNDPPQDIIVVRDVGWYMIGSDYLTPEFSRGLLNLCERFAFHEGGKLTEFIRANEDPPELHDYNLNINDDTPLFVYAAYHHVLTCGGENFLHHIYPSMRRAVEWILTQIEDELVRCHAEGTNVWGICGWRNIIDNYNLTGAVTEINAECYQALQIAAAAAERIGEHTDAARYIQAAFNLKNAINTKLVSEKTGLYALNIDGRGEKHHDVTGDLIFPVFFDVADSEMRDRVLSKLTSEEFWTPFGARTVSNKDPSYDPDFGCQLMGGVWPNLTAWIAYCVGRQKPEKLVEGMRNIYMLSEAERPVDRVNVVPGEFPERLHGETFVSRGMAMSPWMPPTYLWLGVEGLLGVKPLLDGLEINPNLPREWNWIAVRDLLLRDTRISCFLFKGTLYSTQQVKSAHPVVVGNIVESSCENAAIFHIALETGKEILLLVAADEEVEATVVMQHGAAEIEIEVMLSKGEAKLYRPTTEMRPTETRTVSSRE